MMCPDCQTERETFPCPCGYGAALNGVTPTIDQLIRSTHQSRPLGITKEEFGLNLYEVIKTVGGLLGIEQQRAAAIHHGQAAKIPDLIVRRDRLRGTLAKQLPTLNNEEMKQILHTYPWVVSV